MECSYFNRDISWLGFNHRVLLEAGDGAVPVLERIKFLSIYSANLDEFYRVRIPALLSLKKLEQDNPASPYTSLLADIEGIVLQQMKELGAILEHQLIPALKIRKVHLLYNEAIPDFLQKECTDYFLNQVAGFLHPVFLNEKSPGLIIENNKLQLLILLTNEQGEEQAAILNIPDDFISTFYFTDDSNAGIRHIIFLDDIIKENLDKIFTGYIMRGTYSFKITRDAVLDLADEFDGDIADKIEKQLKKRGSGLATRFLYQPGIPLRTLYAVINKLSLSNGNAVAGGNYHNLKSLSSIPLPGKQNFSYESRGSINKKEFITGQSIFNTIADKDIILHTPYQSYLPIIRFFNEASIDNSVEEIYLTIYRVAQDSMIVNALISAAKNGRKVTVFVELKARFDEENNLAWAGKMKEAGVKIIYSIPGFKVHAKMALVKRREAGRLKFYGLLSSGNFNENTARLYTDHILFTAHPGITADMDLLFIFLCLRVQPKKYQGLNFEHLLVSQFNLQNRFMQLIEQEIEMAKQGNKAAITIKINGLEDKMLISKLYEASNAGVQIKLIVRSVCCLIPGITGMSENISVTRIVDRYLEHGRVFIFSNNSQPLVFSGSSDWMNKSMYRRIEVCYPVYDENIKREIMQLMAIQLSDNNKAVQLSEHNQNISITPAANQPLVRSQEAIYHLLKV
jgi:polyphosphate kinase